MKLFRLSAVLLCIGTFGVISSCNTFERNSKDGYWYISKAEGIEHFPSGKETVIGNYSFSANNSLLYLFIDEKTEYHIVYYTPVYWGESTGTIEERKHTNIDSKDIAHDVVGSSVSEAEITVSSGEMRIKSVYYFDYSSIDSEGYRIDKNGNREDANCDGVINSEDIYDRNGDGHFTEEDTPVYEQTIFILGRADEQQFEAWYNKYR